MRLEATNKNVRGQVGLILYSYVNFCVNEMLVKTIWFKENLVLAN